MPRPRAVEDNDLLDAAMFAFWQGGYAGVSTRALEDATGLPASSLYHRYGSKEGLFVATLAHYLERVVGGRIERFLLADDVIAGLRGFFTSVYRADPRRFHGCLLVNTWIEFGRGNARVGTVLARGNRQLAGAFADALRRGQAQGSVRADLDADDGALYLLASLQGLLSTARGERDAARLDAVVELVLHTVATPGAGKATTTGITA